MEEEKKTTIEEIKCQVEDEICNISEEQVSEKNIDYLGKLVDIHKDLANEEYWLKKEDNMMYRGYDNYGRDSYGTYGNDYYNGGRRRDSQGRYMESGRGSYGRRYRGDDMLDEVSEHYGRYMENRNSGRYGSPEMGKSLDYMLQSVEEFMMMLKDDASSQEEVEKIKHTARKISEM